MLDCTTGGLRCLGHPRDVGSQTCLSRIPDHRELTTPLVARCSTKSLHNNPSQQRHPPQGRALANRRRELAARPDYIKHSRAGSRRLSCEFISSVALQ